MLRLSRLWNWKSALHSGLYRAIPFFAAVQAGGGSGAAEGAALQFALFATLAGFIGALVERLRFFRPAWAAAFILLAAVPAGVHSLEWVIHETPAPGGRRAGIFVSWAQSAVSILTQWALMRRGLFLAGEEANSYLGDWMTLMRLLLPRRAGRR